MIPRILIGLLFTVSVKGSDFLDARFEEYLRVIELYSDTPGISEDLTALERKIFKGTYDQADEIHSKLAIHRPKTFGKIKDIRTVWYGVVRGAISLYTKLFDHCRNGEPTENEKQEFADGYFALRPGTRQFFSNLDFTFMGDKPGYPAWIVDCFNEHFAEVLEGATIMKRDEL